MKIKLRDLVNPYILNDTKYVNFLGDSWYQKNDGSVFEGYWNFVNIIENNEVGKIPYMLDDCIDEEELYGDNPCFAVENDNGIVCTVKFIYE